MTEEKKEFGYEEMSETIKDLISDVSKTTEKRESFFNLMTNFALDSDQWYSDEIDIKNAKNAPILTCNFAEDYVEEYLARLFPRNQKTGVLEIGVKIYEENEKNRSEYETEVLDVYQENYLADILIEQGQNFLVGGAACFYYPQDEFDKRAKIISLDPRNVFFGWKGRKIKWFAYKYSDTGNILFCDIDYSILLDEDYKILKVKDNEFNFIPFSWIPCLPKAHEREGRSKVNSIFDLNREYNKSISNFSERVEENTEPHRAVFSDNVKSKDVKRGKGKTTFLGKGDNMKDLELKEGREVLDYLEVIERKIMKKTATVDNSKAGSSEISGLSLSFQYSGMLDRIAFMRIHWDRFFRELNNAILQYKFFEKSDFFRTDPVYHSSMVFDSKQKVEEYQIMRDMKVISRRDVIDELRGSENSENKIKEIKKEEENFDSLNNN